MPLTPNAFKSLLSALLTLPKEILEQAEKLGLAWGKKQGQSDNLKRVANGLNANLEELYLKNDALRYGQGRDLKHNSPDSEQSPPTLRR